MKQQKAKKVVQSDVKPSGPKPPPIRPDGPTLTQIGGPQLSEAKWFNACSVWTSRITFDLSNMSHCSTSWWPLAAEQTADRSAPAPTVMVKADFGLVVHIAWSWCASAVGFGEDASFDLGAGLELRGWLGYQGGFRKKQFEG